MASLPQAVQAQGVTVQQKSTSILQIVTLTSPDGRYDSLYLSNYATISLVQRAVARARRRQRQRVRRRAVLPCGSGSIRRRCRRAAWRPQDVIQAIQQQSQQVTAGQVGAPPAPAGQDFQYTVDVEGRLADPAEFAQHHRQGRQRQRRADHPREGRRPRSNSARRPTRRRRELNGKPSAGIAIYQLPDANALNVATLVQRQDGGAGQGFPAGPGLRRAVRHHAVRQGLDRRGLQDADRGRRCWC